MAFNIVAQVQLQAPKNTKQIIDQIKKQLGGLNTKIDIQVNASSVSNLVKLDKAMGSINTNAKSLLATINSLAGAFSNLGTATSTSVSPLNQMVTATRNLSTNAQANKKHIEASSSAVQDFGRAAGIALRRFVGFELLSGTFIALTNAIKSGISEAIKFDREFLKILQTGSSTSSEILALRKEIDSLSTAFGVSSQDLVKTAVTLRQAGLSATEVKDSLEALAKSTLSPSFDSIAQSTQGLIATLTQFNLKASDSESVLSTISAVAAGFAVESQDLIVAIQKAGGAFAAANGPFKSGKDSLNELLALFTSVRSTTRESADTIATGLRTIFARLQRSDTVETLKALGIELRFTKEEARALGKEDLANQFVGSFEAVQRLSEALKSLPTGDPRFSLIIEQLGGYRQISKVIPLLQQFKVSQEALIVAQSSGISISLSAAQAQDTLAVRLEKLGEQFNVVTRSILDSKAFKVLTDTILTLANALLKAADALADFLPLIAIYAGLKLVSPAKFIPGVSQGIRGIGPKYVNKGGVISGSGNYDSVPAMLTPGEYVLSKEAVQGIGVGRVDRMNRTKRVGFNKGGAVGFAKGGFVPTPEDQASLKIIGKYLGFFKDGLVLTAKELRRAYEEISKVTRIPRTGGRDSINKPNREFVYGIQQPLIKFVESNKDLADNAKIALKATLTPHTEMIHGNPVTRDNTDFSFSPVGGSGNVSSVTGSGAAASSSRAVPVAVTNPVVIQSKSVSDIGKTTAVATQNVVSASTGLISGSGGRQPLGVLPSGSSISIGSGTSSSIASKSFTTTGIPPTPRLKDSILTNLAFSHVSGSGLSGADKVLSSNKIFSTRPESPFFAQTRGMNTTELALLTRVLGHQTFAGNPTHQTFGSLTTNSRGEPLTGKVGINATDLANLERLKGNGLTNRFAGFKGGVNALDFSGAGIDSDAPRRRFRDRVGGAFSGVGAGISRFNESGFGQKLSGSVLPLALAVTALSQFGLGKSFDEAKTEQGARAGFGGAAVRGGLTGIATGAALGSVFGPFGIAIGAAAGGILGLVDSFDDLDKKIRSLRLAEAMDEFTKNIENLNKGTGGNSGTALASLNTIISESKKKALEENTPGFFGRLIGQKADLGAVAKAQNLEVAKGLGQGNISAAAKVLADEIRSNVERGKADAELSPLSAKIAQVLAGFDNKSPTKLVEEITRRTKQEVENEKVAKKFRSGDAINTSATIASLDQFSGALGIAIQKVTDFYNSVQVAEKGISGQFGSGKLQGQDIKLGVGANFGGLKNVFGGASSVLFKQAELTNKAQEALPTIIGEIFRGGNIDLEPIDISKRVTDRLEKILGDSDIAKGIISSIGNNIASFDKNQIREEFQGDPAGLAKKLSKNSDIIEKALNDIAKKLQDGGNTFIELISQVSAKTLSVIDALQKVEDFQLQKEAFGNQARNPFQPAISIQRSEEAFRDRQRLILGQGASQAPGDIGAELSTILDRLEALNIRKNELFNKDLSIGANKDLVATLKEIGALETQAARLQKALSNLENTSIRLAAIQDTLARLDEDKRGRLGLAERFISGSGEEKARIRRSASLTEQAISKGNLQGFTSRQIKDIFEFLKSLGGSTLSNGKTGNENLEALITKAAGNGFGISDINQQREAVIKAGEKVIDEGKKAAEEKAKLEEKSREKFISALETFPQKLQDAITNIIRQLEIRSLEQRRNQLIFEQGGVQNTINKATEQFRTITVPEVPLTKEGIAGIKSQRGNLEAFIKLRDAVKPVNQESVSRVDISNEAKTSRGLDERDFSVRTEAVRSRIFAEVSKSISDPKEAAKAVDEIINNTSRRIKDETGAGGGRFNEKEAGFVNNSVRREIEHAINIRRTENEGKLGEIRGSLRGAGFSADFLKTGTLDQFDGVLKTLEGLDFDKLNKSLLDLQKAIETIDAQIKNLGGGGLLNSQGANVFKESSDTLARAIEAMPSTIQGNFTHTITVNHNGAEAFAEMSEQFAKVAKQQAIDVMKKYYDEVDPSGPIITDNLARGNKPEYVQL